MVVPNQDVSNDGNAGCTTATRVGEQFVSDNIDIQMSSPYGLRSLHALWRIKVTLESSHLVTDIEVEQAKVPPREKQELLQKLEV